MGLSSIFHFMGGWNYHFRPQPAPNGQDFARRATLALYQTFPQNKVQGAGTMVSQNGVNAGKYFNIVQPPQVVATHQAVRADLIAGGQRTIGLYGMALTDNTNSGSGF